MIFRSLLCFGFVIFIGTQQCPSVHWLDWHDQSLCIMNVTNKFSKEWCLIWEFVGEYICWKISLERGSWAYICLSWCEWTQGNWGADKTGGTVFYLIWANILNWREYFRKLLHQRTVQVVSLRLVSVCCGSFGFVHSELGGWAYLIIVTDATDAVSVNFFGRCKFLQI